MANNEIEFHESPKGGDSISFVASAEKIRITLAQRWAVAVAGPGKARMADYHSLDVSREQAIELRDWLLEHFPK